MQDYVEIFEVGPRDGLQNEKMPIPTADKIALINLLSKAGFARIEVASFVSPRWVPQMADSAAVLAGIKRAEGVSYAALTPNLRGFEDAIAAGADEIAIFGSASEGFSQANINCSIAESLERFKPVSDVANIEFVKMRGYVSCVTDCPYDGPTPPDKVADVVEALFAMGCYEVSLGDTIGKGTPESIGRMLDAVLEVADPLHLAGHYHDTNGRALDNIEVSLARGLRVFDAAVGGLGGCPYAPGAAGNVATEAVARRLAELGYETELDLDVIEQAAAMARRMRGV
ncbi:hydroxymethylglutaryl-CoA lyase [Pseudogemmobacter sp. W21_MBD1_M6]|uniref:hydroxymethylglutaryl-CoA lyase n=1 Tax=Pseudogemmobacter sp. W21_MBD1_M6 TaxID=3240271 RepID=UPI003F9E693C